jgi:hypothetical protein
MSTVTDKGVVLLAIGSGTTQAATAPGYGGTPRIMMSGTYRASDSFAVGAASVVAVTVQGNILVSGTGVTVGIERQRNDLSPSTSGLAKWSLVTSTRTDLGGGVIGSGAAQLHNINKSAWTGQNVDTSSGLIASGTAAESLAVTLLTTDLAASTNARLIVRTFSGFMASGDFVIASVDAR